MKVLKAINTSKKSELAARVRLASSLVSRAIGLLGTSSLSAGDGLWITPCKAVHTFFMRYPIDIAALDKNGTVISQGTLGPWRMSRWEPQAESVLELAAGTLSRTHTVIGDHIEFEALN